MFSFSSVSSPPHPFSTQFSPIPPFPSSILSPPLLPFSSSLLPHLSSNSSIPFTSSAVISLLYPHSLSRLTPLFYAPLFIVLSTWSLSLFHLFLLSSVSSSCFRVTSTSFLPFHLLSILPLPSFVLLCTLLSFVFSYSLFSILSILSFRFPFAPETLFPLSSLSLPSHTRLFIPFRVFYLFPPLSFSRLSSLLL